jgi:hypothetical protein
MVRDLIGQPDYEIALMGDSAGGNLACSLMNWIILNGLKKPKGLLLDYPCCLKSVRLQLRPLRLVIRPHAQRLHPLNEHVHALS